MRDARPPVILELWRVRAPAPVAAAPPPAPAPAPAAPAPAPSAPEAPKPPAPVAPTPAPPAATARPAPRDFAEIPEVKPVYFDFDKYDIRPADAEILRANAEWLKARPEMGVLIQGHADERGTEEYNLALGERRARSARNFLVSQGVAADRIAILSFGEERPVCTEKTEACWSRNRRADFLVKPR
ncbi:MAG: peptidoglycan-associated lipoprotein [Candidatus Rokubacteria bacterium RBG_16_73_20]|nr:MAG: peptidoglycan-associated lipoprotein [Candidatus Rokubacteria bacterium GWA2_73_35]OGK90001.1 MAG: peptidoglycan-associated lipoprotein [Candidatus Rokubacteria bacterium RBG_16_73_20]